MDYKIEELKEHIEECAKYYFKDREEMIKHYCRGDLFDHLHQHAFNDDYYIIGTYKAKQWLGDKALEIVAYIQNYQKDNWGEDQIETFLDTDGEIFYERIVNMYTYCRGYELVQDFIEEWGNRYENLDAWLEHKCYQAKFNLLSLIYNAKAKYETV